MPSTILIAEDDKDIRELLKLYLESEGYRILEAENGRLALELAQKEQPDMAILDVMMPEMNGLEVTRALRKSSEIPILILSAKSTDNDKILGLNLGADDYIAKPFNPMEVAARVRSQLRRYTSLGGSSFQSHVFNNGGILMDDDKKEVTIDGEPVNLTHTEYEILKLFLQNPGKVYSPADIYQAVWQESAIGSEGTVAVHIRHLREKVEINPAEPRYLKVVWGQGYRMDRVS